MWSQGIEYLRVRGFKAFADASVQLRPFNAFIGANGAGKSALLALFRMLRSLTQGELEVFVAKSGGADEVLRCAAPPTQTLQVQLGLLTTAGRSHYELTLERTEDNGLLIRRETIERFDAAGQPHESELHTRPVRESELSDSARWGSEHKLLSQFRKYHFANTSATAPARLECDVDDHHELREDGGNLAAFLYRLERTHPGALRRITATVRYTFAEFNGFALNPSALNPRRIALRWRRRGFDGHFGAHQLSDGTLRYLLLATLLSQPYELLPPIVAVDEPELGLHPAALHSIAGLLKAASHHVQLLVASQSAALVDEYEPEDVVVISRRDGVSSFQRLNAEELKEWLMDYSLGELWEKNVIGGGPFG